MTSEWPSDAIKTLGLRGPKYGRGSKSLAISAVLLNGRHWPFDQLEACRAASRQWLLEDVLHGVDWLIAMELLHFPTRSAIALHLSIQLQMHQCTLSSLHNPREASFPAYTTTSIASSTSGSFDVIYSFQPIKYLFSTPDSDTITTLKDCSPTSWLEGCQLTCVMLQYYFSCCN
jgi:hypothetical protein